jgi:polyferredoxin
MSIYTFVIVVIVPALITLILNLFIFKHVRASSRRIQVQANTNSMNITMGQQPKINRRDISLLKHTIYILGFFIIGWAPIYLLIAIDYNGNVIPLVYTILELLAFISLLSCMLDLFLYNHELRRYIKEKFF